MSKITELQGQPLKKVTDKALKLTEKHLNELRRRSKNLAELNVVELQQLTGMISKMQRSLATLLHEARAIEKQAEDGLTGSHEEVSETLVAVFGKLPIEWQRKVQGLIAQGAIA